MILVESGFILAALRVLSGGLPLQPTDSVWVLLRVVKIGLMGDDLEESSHEATLIDL